MAKTRADLRTEIRTFLQETTPTIWTDAEINAALDQALLDIGTVARVEVSTDIAVADGQGSLPGDILLPISFLWPATRTYLRPWPHGEYDFYDTTGTPVFYRIMASTIRLYPKATGTLKCAYWRKASPFSSDTDTVSLPEPETVERMLVEYALAQLKLKEGDATFDIHARTYAALKLDYASRRLQMTQGGRSLEVDFFYGP